MSAYTALPVSSSLSAWLSKLQSVFNIALPQSTVTGGPSKWSRICAHPGMTAVMKAQLSGSVPFAVGAAMVVILLANWALQRPCKRREPAPAGSDYLAERLMSAVDVPVDPGPVTTLEAASADTRAPAPGQALREDAIRVDQECTARPTLHLPAVTEERLRPKYIAAGLNLFLTVYSSLLVTIVAMLHCVHVPGQSSDVKSLFIQGSVVCSYTGWQLGYVLAAVALVATPAIIPLLTSWATRYTSRAGSNERSGSLLSDTCDGFLLAFVAPYGPLVHWWESVMMTHRLGLAILFTFASSAPAIQSLLSIMLCVSFLALHLNRQPLVRPASQGLQSVLLFCLTVVTVCRVFFSSGLEYAVPLNPNIAAAIASTNTFCEVVTLLFQYLIPGIALLMSYVLT